MQLQLVMKMLIYMMIGTPKFIKAREEEAMHVDRQPKAVNGGVPPRGPEREAPGSGRDPGPPLGAGQAEQAHRLERIAAAQPQFRGRGGA